MLELSISRPQWEKPTKSLVDHPPYLNPIINYHIFKNILEYLNHLAKKNIL